MVPLLYGDGDVESCVRDSRLERRNERRLRLEGEEGDGKEGRGDKEDDKSGSADSADEKSLKVQPLSQKAPTWVARVRIIRDRATQLGKGFAYVQFIVSY